MDIFPAIDLKNGCAVRLSKGEMDSAKIYSKEPWELAKQFFDMGAKWLHIVDLDGAFAGEAVNAKVVEKIVSATGLKAQIGGGIRDELRIKSYLNCGVERLILGSIALKNPQFVKDMASRYKIAVGIDAKNGFVAVEGWAKLSQIRAEELATEFKNAGVQAIIATDISKDGMLAGLNMDFTAKIAKAAEPVGVIASGGVSEMGDLEAVYNAAQSGDGNIAGVIVGKAYYEGRLDLGEAFRRFGARF